MAVVGLVLPLLCLDGVQDADELLMSVTLHVAADHRAVKEFQNRRQRRRAIALVVVVAPRAAPERQT